MSKNPLSKLPKLRRKKLPGGRVQIGDRAYPDRYYPGQNKDLDAAWGMLDAIKPGIIPDDVRAYIAGYTVGLMLKAREEGKK